MSGHSQLLPSDRDWPEDNVLFADLSQLNTAIARYVLRQLDIDAQQAEPMPVEEEHDLGRQLVEVGDRIQRRAARQGTQATQAGQVVDGGQTSGMDRDP